MQLCRSDGPCSPPTPATPSACSCPDTAPRAALGLAGSAGQAGWAGRGGQAGVGRQGRLAGMGLAAGEHQHGYKKQEWLSQQQDTAGDVCQPGREGSTAQPPGSEELAQGLPASSPQSRVPGRVP